MKLYFWFSLYNYKLILEKIHLHLLYFVDSSSAVKAGSCTGSSIFLIKNWIFWLYEIINYFLTSILLFLNEIIRKIRTWPIHVSIVNSKPPFVTSYSKSAVFGLSSEIFSLQEVCVSKIHYQKFEKISHFHQNKFQ